MNSIIYRGKSQPKDANSHSRSPWHPLGNDLHCLALSRTQVCSEECKSSCSAAKYCCCNQVFDTGRASPDIASVAPTTSIRLEKCSIARMRDGKF
ncbi:hypothetical protein QUB40_28020 [Microcoleus sp. AT9_A2]|uniref:hypothetical protein n=1 Tax=Microcoleus sp. AT9_A2 TaxID=2818624 RepID=UPI002FD2A2AB